MNNKSLAFSADNVTISGKYFTVSNAFISKADGEVKIRRGDLLSVEIVKRRSKRAMYAVLILGSILVMILNFVRTDIKNSYADVLNSASSQELYDNVNTTMDKVKSVLSDAALIILIIFVAIITLAGAIYLFSGRQFVELTTMRGTYRVELLRDDTEIKGIAKLLQASISNLERE